MTTTEFIVKLRRPHPKQQEFLDSTKKRIIIRAGRRGGKTTGMAIKAVQAFLEGRRVLYATPTADQIGRFWYEVVRALQEPLEAGILYKNETQHIIERPGTENRLRAKTAWNADTLRGDYADLLILDEWQLMNEDAWEYVGAPMMLDNNGDAVFIYTPPSLHSRSVTKARDPRHAAKLYKKAEQDPRWDTFHFTSYDNPHLNEDAFAELEADMTTQAREQEILARDTDEAPGALWKRSIIDEHRRTEVPELVRVGVGVDPPGGATECGIIVAGIGHDRHGYILEDASLKASPEQWAAAVIAAYDYWQADFILGEKNYGGDMVESTIRAAAEGRNVNYRNVNATRGKAVRAEPCAALQERGLIHHAGEFPLLEDELCMWIPASGMKSPNRLDGYVWVITELLVNRRQMAKDKAPELLQNHRG